MKLSRRALRREVKVLEARARLDSTTIETQRTNFTDAVIRVTSLQAEVDALRAEPRAAGPALAENVRLAHRAEQAELRQRQAQAERDALMEKLLRLAVRHPHLFEADEIAS